MKNQKYLEATERYINSRDMMSEIESEEGRIAAIDHMLHDCTNQDFSIEAPDGTIIYPSFGSIKKALLREKKVIKIHLVALKETFVAL